MDQATALKRLSQWDRHGRFVFTRADLAKLFHEDSPRALKDGLRRLVAGGLLEPMLARDTEALLTDLQRKQERGADIRGGCPFWRG
jgi:hypothetical protein